MEITDVLFDLDGTLINSFPGISACFKYALSKMDVEFPGDDFLRRCVGPPLDFSFREFFRMSDDDALRAVAFYRERYAVKGIFECEMISGARECLKALNEAGKNICLATSKPEPYAVKILKRFDVAKYFRCMCGSDFDVTLKTKSDVIREALKRGEVKDKKSCVMVGDRKYDIFGAEECGLRGIGIKNEIAEKGELEQSGAIYVAKDFFDLTNYILGENTVNK